MLCFWTGRKMTRNTFPYDFLRWSPDSHWRMRRWPIVFRWFDPIWCESCLRDRTSPPGWFSSPVSTANYSDYTQIKYMLLLLYNQPNPTYFCYSSIELGQWVNYPDIFKRNCQQSCTKSNRLPQKNVLHLKKSKVSSAKHHSVPCKKITSISLYARSRQPCSNRAILSTSL